MTAQLGPNEEEKLRGVTPRRRTGYIGPGPCEEQDAHIERLEAELRAKDDRINELQEERLELYQRKANDAVRIEELEQELRDTTEVIRSARARPGSISDHALLSVIERSAHAILREDPKSD